MVIGREHLRALIHLASKSRRSRFEASALDLLAPFADDPEVMRLFIARVENGLDLNQFPAVEEAFAKHGKAVVPELSRLLFSEDENTRRRGANLLCSTNELSALPAVLDYLARVGEKERSDLKSALWKFSNQRSVLEVALNHGSH